MPPGDVADGTTVVRVLPAAEHGELTDEAHTAFWTSEWQLSTSSNRVGYRLVGPALRLHRPIELLSHGILPGVIQLPPSGQPMIQMSDANTCGGYPKIGLVIGPTCGDWPRFASAAAFDSWKSRWHRLWRLATNWMRRSQPSATRRPGC